MNPVLNSNASSALVSVLDKVDTQSNPFEYKYSKNEKGTALASCSRSWQETTTTSAVALNSAVDFHLSKNGILNNIVVKMQLTFANNDDKVIFAMKKVIKVYHDESIHLKLSFFIISMYQ